MVRGRVVPYPKRLKELIKSYKETKSKSDFNKIHLLVDRLLIKIVQQIYKYESYAYLRRFQPNEIYHTAIIAMEKAIRNFDVDDGFSAKKLSSRLNGYVGKEFQMTFGPSSFYVGFDDIGDDVEVNVSTIKADNTIGSIIESIKTIKPKFPDKGIEALKLHLAEDMSLQEIAEYMGVKKGCVRSWVDRGKRVLKVMITKERKQGLWPS